MIRVRPVRFMNVQQRKVSCPDRAKALQYIAVVSYRPFNTINEKQPKMLHV